MGLFRKKDPSFLGVPRVIVLCVLLLAVTIFAGILVTVQLRVHAMEELSFESRSQASILTAEMQHELKELDNLVRVLAGSPVLLRVLSSGQAGDLSAVNQTLDRYTEVLNNAVGYVMNLDGVTIASSNRNSPASFIGKNYAFRPYFQQAARGSPGHYLGLGVTSHRRGYYASCPVTDSTGRVWGVAVLKRGMETVQEALQQFGNCFLVDPHGVIFLSGNPLGGRRALWPVSAERQQQILMSQQFGPGPFTALLARRPQDGQVVNLQGKKYLYFEKIVNNEGWSLVLLVSLRRVFVFSIFGVISTGLVALLIIAFSAVVMYSEWSSRKVRKSEARFKQIALTSRDWIWETDVSGAFSYSNNAIYDIIGVSPQDILRKDFFSVVEEDPSGQNDLRLKMAQNDSLYQRTAKMRCKGGRPVFVEITASPRRDERGTFLGYRGVTRDVTERARQEEALRAANRDLSENDTALKNILYDLQEANQELKEAQQQVVQSEKLSSIGQLAAGVAHEVKNPLAIISLSVQTLEKHLVDLDEKGRSIIGMIKSAAQRANKVVIELLSFSRSSEMQKTVLDIHEVIDGAITISQNGLLIKDIVVRREFADANVMVLGDRILLQQVFFNLITNAMDAIETQGEIVVTTTEGYDQEAQGEMVTIKVKDTGCGISPDKCLKIFDPFFTTKKIGKGTGLGLSTVYMILERHQGRIVADSQPGVGTTFTITLPKHSPVSRLPESAV